MPIIKKKKEEIKSEIFSLMSNSRIGPFLQNHENNDFEKIKRLLEHRLVAALLLPMLEEYFNRFLATYFNMTGLPAR